SAEVPIPEWTDNKTSSVLGTLLTFRKYIVIGECHAQHNLPLLTQSIDVIASAKKTPHIFLEYRAKHQPIIDQFREGSISLKHLSDRLSESAHEIVPSKKDELITLLDKSRRKNIDVTFVDTIQPLEETASRETLGDLIDFVNSESQERYVNSLSEDRVKKLFELLVSLDKLTNEANPQIAKIVKNETGDGTALLLIGDGHLDHNESVIQHIGKNDTLYVYISTPECDAFKIKEQDVKGPPKYFPDVIYSAILDQWKPTTTGLKNEPKLRFLDNIPK
ncbi:MAG TPA: hypothetical protein DCY07_04115, partial [Rhodospirillaceae bacterium]|nr:hypothetical protein [Rhodospirillaceae bacterium]